MTSFVPLPQYVHEPSKSFLITLRRNFRPIWKREVTLLSDAWHGYEFWRHMDGRLLLHADGAWYEVNDKGHTLFGLAEEFNRRTGRISE